MLAVLGGCVRRKHESFYPKLFSTLCKVRPLQAMSYLPHVYMSI